MKEPMLQSRRFLVAAAAPFIAAGLQLAVEYVPWLSPIDADAVAQWVIGLAISFILGRSVRNAAVGLGR